MGTHLVTLIGVLGVVAILSSVAIYKELAVYISVVGLGLAVALQKYVTSFFGYLVIYYGKLFKPGDRVRLGSIKGDVRRIGILHTALEEVGDDEKLGGELTGRILRVPNLMILDQPILNYSKEYPGNGHHARTDYLFDEVRIPVTTGSDINHAKNLLEEILRRQDKPHLQAATSMFGKKYAHFTKEAENGPRVEIYLESKKVWLKGKFVTPISDRNSLRTHILLEFMDEARKQNGLVKLA